MCRKAELKDDENPNKRQRFANDEKASACLLSLNTDCVLHILSFLPVDDINTFAMISNRYRQIRRHTSLDQTRTATIICSRRKHTTSESLCTTLEAARRTLSAHYTHLKVLGLETVEDNRSGMVRVPIETLSNVAKLELALNPNEPISGNRRISKTLFRILADTLPNMKELVLSRVEIGDHYAGATPVEGLAHLDKVQHVGSSMLHLTGWNYRDARGLTELSLDGCCLFHLVKDPLSRGVKSMLLDRYSNETPNANMIQNHFLFCHCRHLQRLSIKGAIWVVSTYINPFIRSQSEPIPQEMIIKMVRFHQTLRWLRSDLSEGNVAMLQQERPEITFVSE